ncbi:MAG TPA: 50S ribosomal protein L23 [Candidatus Paceibacterota bacterium]|nr:50S ribosomal protein L23 [Candidatus Paceibacterota bacterium]
MPLFKKNTVSKNLKEASKKTPVIADHSFSVLKGLRLTEKATALQGQNQYIFEINKCATKAEIKKAIEKEYKVTVSRVNTINSPAKPKHFGRHVHKKNGVAKAMVTIKEGQKIETGI